MTADGDIIRSKEVGTIKLTLLNGSDMTLSNVAFAPRCDSNLISLGQLREAGISYHDHPESMILKKAGIIIGSAQKKKNLFALDLLNDVNRIMISQRRRRPTYLLSKDPAVRLWHRCFAHASNAWIVQASKLVDGIKLSDAAASNLNDDLSSSDSEAEDREGSEPDVNRDIDIAALLNKIIENIEDLCNTCIESKHTRIVKHKPMTPTVQKLEEIHANLWGLHKPPSISGKSYVGLLLDEHIQKSWVLLLRGKDEFFDAFKQWLP